MRLILLCLALGIACTPASQPDSRDLSRTVVVYDTATIEPNIAIWNPQGINVGGFRYANVFVEFEQHAIDEEPLSVGVGFAPYEDGRIGTRNVFDFSAPGGAPQSDSDQKLPTWISGSGKDSWHGEQGISSYLVRVPVMGPYMWVYPQNNHSKARKFSVVVYLTRD